MFPFIYHFLATFNVLLHTKINIIVSVGGNLITPPVIEVSLYEQLTSEKFKSPTPRL